MDSMVMIDEQRILIVLLFDVQWSTCYKYCFHFHVDSKPVTFGVQFQSKNKVNLSFEVSSKLTFRTDSSDYFLNSKANGSTAYNIWMTDFRLFTLPISINKTLRKSF